MPTYEYQCRSCAHRFDAFQGITASPLRRCPHCGKKVDRLISSGAGFLFKGSGFYTTDYRSKPYQEAARKDQEWSGWKWSEGVLSFGTQPRAARAATAGEGGRGA